MQFAVKDGVRRAIIPGTLASSGLKAAGWVLDQDGDGAADDTTRNNLLGGRQVVAADTAAGNNTFLRNNTVITGQNRHLITMDCSDIRLVYSARAGGLGSALGVLPETDLSNIVYIQAGVATSSSATAWYPVTFGGKKIGELAPGYATLISDAVPVDLTAGSYLYERTHQFHTFGVATTLAASTSANATSFTTVDLPGITSGNFVVDTGSNLEVVEVVAVTGSGPYTCTINPNSSTGATRNKLLLAHSSGVAVYQQLFTDRYVYADRNEGKDNYTSALSAVPVRAYSGTATVPAVVTTTLSSAVNIGDRSVPLAAVINTPTLVLGSGGTSETVTVTNVIGSSAPYTYYLSAPLANAQSSGATVTSGTGVAGNVFGAKCIVADRVSAASSKPSIVVVGDSISAGSGYNIRGGTSYVELALGATNPIINVAIGSDKAQTFLSADNSVGRRKWFGAGGWLILQLGTNDLAVASRTSVQLQGDIAALMALARARGMKVALTTVLPRPTSTSDAWATVANQTLGAWEAERLAFNAWLRAGSSGADLLLDIASKVDSGLVAGGTETGKWLAAHTTNGPYTGDGVHPSTIGHVAISAAINPTLFT